MKDIQTKLSWFEKDINLNKHIISRFDEILTEKASKFSINQINSDLKSYINERSFKEFEDKL